MEAELYAKEESIVKKTGPWIDTDVYKKVKVSFVSDGQYYNSSSLELGVFEIDLSVIRYWAEQTGVMKFTQSYLVGLGNAAKGDMCMYVNIDVDSTYKKIKISSPTINPGIFTLKVIMEK